MARPQPIARRHALALLSSAAVLAPAPAPADGPGQDLKPRNRPPAIKQRYSQDEFVQLTRRQVEEIWAHSHGGTVTPRIAGFSHYLDGYLFTMVAMSRRRAQRLVRDMAGLKAGKARRARLAREVASSQGELAKLEKALVRARARKSKHAIRETEYRIATEKLYLDAAKRWLKDPAEGTR